MKNGQFFSLSISPNMEDIFQLSLSLSSDTSLDFLSSFPLKQINSLCHGFPQNKSPETSLKPSQNDQLACGQMANFCTVANSALRTPVLYEHFAITNSLLCPWGIQPAWCGHPLIPTLSMAPTEFDCT